MNLFGGKEKKADMPPSIDEARQRIESMKRGQRMQGRAAAMLTQGKQSNVARRDVTGN